MQNSCALFSTDVWKSKQLVENDVLFSEKVRHLYHEKMRRILVEMIRYSLVILINFYSNLLNLKMIEFALRFSVFLRC
jgi:hypothetical protein